MPMDADDEPAPRSEPTCDRPPPGLASRLAQRRAGSITSQFSTDSSIDAPRPSSSACAGRRATCGCDDAGAPPVWDISRRRSSLCCASGISAFQAKALELEAQKRTVHKRLAEVDTTYDAFYARRLRIHGWVGNSKIDQDTLRRDVQRVNELMARGYRFIVRPHGRFMLALDLATTISLMYTAIVTPYEIAFLSAADVVALTVINWLIFAVFMLGMIVNFMLPYREPLWKGGGIVKSHKKIAQRYMRSWFIFDLISTLPFDQIVEGVTNGSTSDGGGTSSVLSGTRLVRLVRLVRLLKMGRLLRAQRIVMRMVERIEGKSEWLNWSFTARTMVFWMIVVVMSIHWFCCSWGIVALLQRSQRTPELSASLSTECRAASAAQVASSDCLTPCELSALAQSRGEVYEYALTQEPWLCRRMAEGLLSRGASRDGMPNGSEAYMHLLQQFGLMTPTRPEENLVKFVFAFLYLTLDTLFKGGISGARAVANPLRKAWQARMDHLNLFLKEMGAPPDLKERTRQYLRNTRDLELKRSFNSLYAGFSKQLSNEMRSHMSISIVRGVYYFNGLEAGFLRDLASKLRYEAFERGERITHGTPTLSIVVQGTAVRGGKPYGIGECFGEDAIIASNALRDVRVVAALTYCEICSVSKEDIHATAKSYPRAVRRLRVEALKIAMYRAPQLIAQYAASNVGAAEGRRSGDLSHLSGVSAVSGNGFGDDELSKHSHASGLRVIDEALQNLGRETHVPLAHCEVHTYFHSINGGARLRGLASEQVNSTDPQVATAAEAAMDLANDTLIEGVGEALVDEDGNMVDGAERTDRSHAVEEMKRKSASMEKHEELAAEVQDLKEGVQEMRDELMKAIDALQQTQTQILKQQMQTHANGVGERADGGIAADGAAHRNGKPLQRRRPQKRRTATTVDRAVAAAPPAHAARALQEPLPSTSPLADLTAAAKPRSLGSSATEALPPATQGAAPTAAQAVASTSECLAVAAQQGAHVEGLPPGLATSGLTAQSHTAASATDDLSA